MKRRHFLLETGGLIAVTASGRKLHAQAAQFGVSHLAVDHMESPLGLENRSPCFSWRLQSAKRNLLQAAYRIKVASSKERLLAGEADLWDSQKVLCQRSFGVRYEGLRLRSRQRCWWRVEVWGEGEDHSADGPIGSWEMGLLASEDWGAEWLAIESATMRSERQLGWHWIWGPADNRKGGRLFRCRFSLPFASLSGEIFAVVNDAIATGVLKGIWIDGTGIEGDPRFTPGRSVASTIPSLSGQCLPLPAMDAGEHVLAVEVEAGMLPKGMAHGFGCVARFFLESGATLRISSEQRWRTSVAGKLDWRCVEYDDTAWDAARPVPISFHPLPPAPAFNLRKEFSIERLPVAARLYATALGAYEARLNGARIGSAQLTPEISQYAKRARYQVMDVTKMLRVGRNALCFTVGDGWYASWDGLFAWGPPPRRILAQLELAFGDGVRKVVQTGPDWQIAQSPIQTSILRVGEVYDARLEQPGWDAPVFDAAHWETAQVTEPPPCQLSAQTDAPIRVMDVLKPRTITQPRHDVYVFDFGQSFAGWCRLHVRGERGTRIELQFADALLPTGELNQGILTIGELKRDVFILKGAPGIETFEPHFTYRGFRYVQISGLPAPPKSETLEGLVVHSELRTTGCFRVDSPLIEQTWRNIVWTQRSNFVSTPTDNPHREQRGWMGDAGLFWETAAFNMDVRNFTARHMENARDDQHDDGELTVSPPQPRLANSVFVEGAGAVWGDAGIILPWTAWRHYGDLAIIEQNWAAMNRYLESIRRRNPDFISRNRTWDIGDHLGASQAGQVQFFSEPVPATPVDLISTAYWAYSVQLLAEMAQATGRIEEAAELNSVLDRIRIAFIAEFIAPDGTLRSGTQTAYVLALQFGLVPDDLRRAAAKNLAADIVNRGVALTTGIVGTRFILDVLVEQGYSELAYSLLLRTEAPSWGYMIQHGATTIWEHWTGQYIRDGKTETGSLNQYAFGSIGGFFFRRIAGIDAAAPGFEKVVIKPVLDRRIKRAGGDYYSVMGRISTDWIQRRGIFKLELELPSNTTGRVHLPFERGKRVSESRRSVSNRSDMRVLDVSAREIVVGIGSGTYSFVVDG